MLVLSVSMARFFEAPVGLFWNLRSAIVGIGPTPNDKLTKFKGLETYFY